MKTKVLVAAMLLLAIQMFAAMPAEAQALEAQDIMITNLLNGFTISWTTNQPVTGWIRYGLDNPNTGQFLWANDTRGAETVSRTHKVTVDYNDDTNQGKTVYFDIYGGQNVRLTSTGSRNFTIPVATDFNPPAGIVMGKVTTGLAPISNALVYVNVTRGTQVSLSMSALTMNDGTYVMTLANGILFPDPADPAGEYSTYIRQAGDILRFRVNAGPYGTTTYNMPLTSDMVGDSAMFIDIPNMVIPLPFSVTGLRVHPETGDAGDTFLFSVVYNSTDGIGPDSVTLMLNGEPLEMETTATTFGAGATYTVSTNELNAGTNEYYVIVQRGDITFDTSTYAGGTNVLDVSAPPINGEDSWDMTLIIGILAGVAVAIVVAFVVMKKR